MPSSFLKSACAVFFAALHLSPAFAFNQDECGNLFPKIGDRHPPYFSPLYTVTMLPSTTSYMSSWGKCSMYGSMPVVQRRKFIAASYESISSEAARGDGEYLATLASLSGCPADKNREFSRAMRNSFDKVFVVPRGEEVEIVARRIDAVISSHSDLRRHCAMIN